MDFLEELDSIRDGLTAGLRRDPTFSTVLDGTVCRADLVALYADMWHMMNATIPSLAAAWRCLSLYAGDDPRFQGEAYARFKTPAYAAITAEMSKHAREETGHDQWAARDLEVLGVSRDELRRSRPSPGVQLFNAAFRRAAFSAAPIAVTGMAYMIEGGISPLWSTAVEHLRSRSQIPNIQNALSCIEQHGRLDAGHSDDERTRLGSLVDPRDRDAVLLNARLTADALGGIGHDARIRTEWLAAAP